MLNKHSLDQIFDDARTHSHWLDKAVSDDVLKQIYDHAKFGPTSANCSPMRIVFVKSASAKEALKPCLAEGNVDKTMSAPVTAIIAQDMEFYEELPTLFPHTDARSWFLGKTDYIKETALRNTALQGAYFIIAARALGLDCGPMSGFDPEKLNQAFFEGTSYRSNFLINLGYGDKQQLHPRSPRLSFEEACKFA